MTKVNKIIVGIIILKCAALYLSGSVILGGFLIIVQHYDQTFKMNSWIISTVAINWYIYVFCKGCLEFIQNKK